MSIASRLQGVHHIGITVENMERAFEFYTEVLGGTPILIGNGFKGPEIHNALLEKEDIEHQNSVPNLRDGVDELDVRFVQFDNVVIELLNYHQARAEGQDLSTFPAFAPETSPAIINSMHISFYLKDEVDIDQFANDIEAKAAERGFDKVKINRISRNGDGEIKTFKVEQEGNSFDGWDLIYLKGPSGEQLEFNRVTRKVKEAFTEAYNKRHGK